MPFGIPGTPVPQAQPTPEPQPPAASKPMFGLPASAAAPKAAFGIPLAAAPPKPSQHAASFLEKVSDVLDVPLAYLEAGISDLGQPGPGGNPFAIGEGTHTKRVTQDLQHGGAHAVAQNDIYFRQGSLQRVLADPTATHDQKATAQWFLHHPWAAGAADFAGEFGNPSNLILGPALGAAGKVLRPVARLATKLPFVGEGIDAATNFGRSLVDKYWPLRKLSPKAAQLGRLSDAAARMATKHNTDLQAQIYGLKGAFKGTTAEERYEIWRRAHGMQPMQPEQLAQQFPHTPGFSGRPGTLTDAELNARAQMERNALAHLDQEQLQRGWADTEDLMGDYFPIRPKQFYDEDAFERAAATFAGMPGRVGAAGLRYRGPMLKSKTFLSPDEILQANERMGGSLLAKGADPANELLAHLNKVSGNIALDEFIRRLTQEAPEAARELDASSLGFHVPGGTVTNGGVTRQVSSGEATLAKGLQIASRNARAQAARKAIDEIAQRYGMNPADVSRLVRRNFPTEARLSARMAELERTPRTIVKGGAKALTRPQKGTLITRGQQLATALADPERPIANEYRKLRDEFDKALQPKARERMLSTLNPSGYNLVKNVPGLSGLQRLKYTSLEPELVKYLTDYGAPSKEASGLAAVLDRFNALYRIGIVTNPIVHPFYNLLWGYLGSGGNPARLTRVFRSGETTLDREAEKYGAHAFFNPASALGGSNAQMLLGRFSQAPGMLGKADWALSRIANANRALVFDRIERNMATELWDDLAKKNIARGMDAETAKRMAGEQVRKAFGDYDNITSAERHIARAFYFYPWTKTVIPFWIKAGIQRLQMVTGPMRAIQTHNVLAGDPNVGKEKMGTVYMGKDANGQPVYKTVPLPQRWLEDVGEIVVPRVGGQADIGAGLAPRLNALSNIAFSHMTPGLNVAANTARQFANQEPQEPGVTPASGVVFNREAPMRTQLQQIGSYAAQQMLPFGGNTFNMAQALHEALKGVPQAIPQALLGGYVYSERTPQEQRMLNRYMTEFQRKYAHAYRFAPAQRARMQEQAYLMFRRKVDFLLQQKQ